MSATNPTQKTTATDAQIDELDDRDIKALLNPMTVIDNAGDVADEPGRYEVTTESQYTVDLNEESCTCPDHEYRGVRCYHIRRVEFETGVRAIPGWVSLETVDDQLGMHIENGEPRIAMTDGGAVAAKGGREPTALDRFFEPHKVIGVDSKGRIHHYHAAYGREYTFEEDGGAVYVIDDDGSMKGYELGEKTSADWIQQVDEACGWDDMRMVSLPADDLEAAGLGGGDE